MLSRIAPLGTELVELAVTVGKRVEPGAFVRPAGEDIRAGDVVIGAGQTISPAEIGVLAALGYARVRVHRRPRVAVLSTGNELADLGTEPGPGQIPNTNTYSLMAQVVEAGAKPVSLGVVPDRLEATGERIRRAARKMAGCPAVGRPRIWGRVLEPIRSPGGRRGYLRVTLARDGREYGARLTGDQGSGILSSMVRADGLAVVAPDTIVPVGERV